MPVVRMRAVGRSCMYGESRLAAARLSDAFHVGHASVPVLRRPDHVIYLLHSAPHDRRIRGLSVMAGRGGLPGMDVLLPFNHDVGILRCRVERARCIGCLPRSP